MPKKVGTEPIGVKVELGNEPENEPLKVYVGPAVLAGMLKEGGKVEAEVEKVVGAEYVVGKPVEGAESVVGKLEVVLGSALKPG